jgi:A1 cistron-splicing factor AAR2
MAVLGYLQLAFVLLLHLSSYSSLTMYQRLLTLFTRSHSLLANPQTYIPNATPNTIRKAYTSLLHTLAIQLGALPKNAFDMELPEMDLFYLEEIEQLRTGLSSLCGSSGKEGEKLGQAWQALKTAAKGWGWDIGDLKSASGQSGDEPASDEAESEEEGEYAPQIVET